MVGALLVLVVFVGLCVVVAIHTARMPKKPDHEREPERLHDPMLTSHKSGQGGL